jgi:hypothetical protein
MADGYLFSGRAMIFESWELIITRKRFIEFWAVTAELVAYLGLIFLGV